jgi:hypothetical protein
VLGKRILLLHSSKPTSTEMSPVLRTLVCSAMIFAGAAPNASAAIIKAPVARDNTIFESPNTNSNGQGETFFSGASGGVAAARRGLLAFDVSGIPAGSQINRVTLRLTLADVAAQELSARNVSLHRLLGDWGEGASNAGNTGGSGNGIAAATGDTTWLQQFFNTDPWTTPGGDFAASTSATTAVGVLADVGNVYTWETLRGGSPSGMVLDVESWLASPTANFGWLLKVDNEPALRTVRRYWSSEASNTALRPTLEIEYSTAAVPETSSLTLCAIGYAVGLIGWRGLRRRRQGAAT